MNQMDSFLWKGIDLAEAVARGDTTKDIADVAGTSVPAVRTALSRRGLVSNPPAIATLRSSIQDMKPTEAVEHLLWVLEETNPALAGQPHLVDSWGLDLPRGQYLLLTALVDASPRVVPVDVLLTVLSACNVYGDAPQAKITAVYVSKIRKVLPASIGKIRTAWGVGYAFEPEGRG